MKAFLIGLGFILACSTAQAEIWKGNTQSPPYEIGAMSGLGLYGDQASWSFLGNVATLIEPEGWIDDIDDRVWAEFQGGPAFFTVQGNDKTAFQYSAHMRWDFTRDATWTVYGLGGVAGFINAPGDSFSFHPRFGIGALFQTKLPLVFRFELSHEFSGLGVAFNF